MPDHSNETQAIETLRKALKELSLSGVSYSDVCAQTSASSGWTSESIRKFASRSNRVRITPKVRDLAATVTKILDKESQEEFSLSGPEKTEIRTLNPFVNQKFDNSEFSIEIGSRFRRLRENALSAVLPDKFAYVRYGRDKNVLITLLVQIKRSAKGYNFSMKISGSAQRIVIGDVSVTLSNTYFTGMAYALNHQLEKKEFATFDAFDLNEMDELVSRNEIGIESFCFASRDISNSTIPAFFFGLDGSGNPISGLGLIIDKSEFDFFGIEEDVLSKATCAASSPVLNKAMSKINAETLKSIEGGAHALKLHLTAKNSD